VIDFWAPLALTTSTVALLALPVTPALYELWKRKDAGPLPTSRHDGAVDNFAKILADQLEIIRPEMEACRNKRDWSHVRFEGMNALIVGNENFGFDSVQMQGVALVACACDATVPSGSVIAADIYSDANLKLERGAVARAVMAVGDVTLTEESTVLRWLSANGDAILRTNSAVYGRLSGNSIYLSPGCRFQRLFAKSILTLGPTDAEFFPLSNPKPDPTELKIAPMETRASRRQRARVDGDFTLPAKAALDTNLIVTGKSRFKRGSFLSGSTKIYKDSVFEEGATVRGSIVCGGSLHIGRKCFVAGPIMAEDSVTIDRDCRIGTFDSPTTVSARRIRIAPGCQLHGTVWARVQGSVES